MSKSKISNTCSNVDQRSVFLPQRLGQPVPILDTDVSDGMQGRLDMYGVEPPVHRFKLGALEGLIEHGCMRFETNT